ncbi:hypothetical protein DL766_001868 [Monosporascus sp. MC13-8B]|nr:hypothetical protein DL766_001868 [Monosporascus sp. MC13-8B]
MGTVDCLRSKESEMSWSSLVTGAFFDWAMKMGIFRFRPRFQNPLIAMLEHADETKNQYVSESSFNVGHKGIPDVVEKVDSQKWTVKYVTSEEVIANGKRRLAAGDFAGIIDLTRDGAFGKQVLGDSRPYGLWDDKLGLPKKDIEQAVRDVL